MSRRKSKTTTVNLEGIDGKVVARWPGGQVDFHVYSFDPPGLRHAYEVMLTAAKADGAIIEHIDTRPVKL